MHRVLAVAGYNPPGVAFPISAILRHVNDYRSALESYSRTVLPLKRNRRSARPARA